MAEQLGKRKRGSDSPPPGSDDVTLQSKRPRRTTDDVHKVLTPSETLPIEHSVCIVSGQEPTDVQCDVAIDSSDDPVKLAAENQGTAEPAAISFEKDSTNSEKISTTVHIDQGRGCDILPAQSETEVPESSTADKRQGYLNENSMYHSSPELLGHNEEEAKISESKDAQASLASLDTIDVEAAKALTFLKQSLSPSKNPATFCDQGNVESDFGSKSSSTLYTGSIKRKGFTKSSLAKQHLQKSALKKLTPLRSSDADSDSQAESSLTVSPKRMVIDLQPTRKSARQAAREDRVKPWSSMMKRGKKTKLEKTFLHEEEKKIEENEEKTGKMKKKDLKDKRKVKKRPLDAEEVQLAQTASDLLEKRLEENAAKNNLSVVNVKNILHHVITNEHVLAMVRHTVEDESPDCKSSPSSPPTREPMVFEPKMTRAKLKEVSEKSGKLPFVWPVSPVKRPKPQFTELSFSEDDEDDDDYRPSQEDLLKDESDYESNTSLGSPCPSTPRSLLNTSFQETDIDDDETKEPEEASRTSPPPSPPCTPSTSVSTPPPTKGNHLRAVAVPMGPPPPRPRPDRLTDDVKFLRELEEINLELEKSEDTIAHRTRSKFPIEMPLEEIEASFIAPDITADMFDTWEDCGEDNEEWVKWLAGLYHGPTVVSDVPDDDQNDPEYNFLAEEEAVDEEDFRDDKTVQISKKEVNELLDELIEAYEKEDWGADLNLQHIDRPPQPTLSDMIAAQRQAVSQKDITKNKKDAQQPQQQHVMVLTDDERTQLQQQMQQHVQLLAQMYFLSKESAALEPHMSQAKMFLNEMHMLATQSEATLLAGFQNTAYACSAFRPCNLAGALGFIAEDFKVTEKEQGNETLRSSTEEGPKRRGQRNPPSKGAQRIIAHSSVFMYSELLPMCSVTDQRREKIIFEKAEDNLIVLGLMQFPTKLDRIVLCRMICQNMLPIKTSRQVMVRIKNVCCKLNSTNVIKNWRRHGIKPILTAPCTPVLPENAKAPVDQNELFDKRPEWLEKYLPLFPPQRPTVSPFEPSPTDPTRPKEEPKTEKSGKTTPIPASSTTESLNTTAAPGTSKKKLSRPRTPSFSKLEPLPVSADIKSKGPLRIHSSFTRIAPKPVKGQKVLVRNRQEDLINARGGTTVKVITTSGGARPQLVGQHSKSLALIGSASVTNVNPAFDTSMNPACATDGNLVSATNVNPDSDTRVNPASATNVNPTSATSVNPASATSVNPASGTNVNLASVTSVNPTSATSVNPTSVTSVNPASGTNENLVSFTGVNSASATSVNPTSATSVNIASATNMNPTGTIIMSPTPATTIPTATSTVNPATSTTMTCASAIAVIPKVVTTMNSAVAKTVNPTSLTTVNPTDTTTVTPVATSTGTCTTFTIANTATTPSLSSANSVVPSAFSVSSTSSVSLGRISALQNFKVHHLAKASLTTNLNKGGGIKSTNELSSKEQNGDYHNEESSVDMEKLVSVKEEDSLNSPLSSDFERRTVEDENAQNDAASPPSRSKSTSPDSMPDDGVDDGENASTSPGENIMENTDSNSQDALDADSLAMESSSMPEDQLEDSNKETKKDKTKMAAKRIKTKLRRDLESTVVLLDANIVSKDPKREEREMSFSRAYLNKVKERFSSDPERYVEFLGIFNSFAHLPEIPAPELFQRICHSLEGHADLVEDFTAFLPAEVALECGVLMENLEFAKARLFLRQVEVHFQKNPSQFQKILSAIMEWGSKENKDNNELKESILPLLKGQPHLEQEFSLLCPDERPPDSHMTDFEEIIWDDDRDKEYDSFEEIEIPDSDEEKNVVKARVGRPPNKPSSSTQQAPSNLRTSSLHVHGLPKTALMKRRLPSILKSPARRKDKGQVLDPWQELNTQLQYGTKGCKCSCHEKSSDTRIQRMVRHCNYCSITRKELISSLRGFSSGTKRRAHLITSTKDSGDNQGAARSKKRLNPSLADRKAPKVHWASTDDAEPGLEEDDEEQDEDDEEGDENPYSDAVVHLSEMCDDLADYLNENVSEEDEEDKGTDIEDEDFGNDDEEEQYYEDLDDDDDQDEKLDDDFDDVIAMSEESQGLDGATPESSTSPAVSQGSRESRNSRGSSSGDSKSEHQAGLASHTTLLGSGVLLDDSGSRANSPVMYSEDGQSTEDHMKQLKEHLLENSMEKDGRRTTPDPDAVKNLICEETLSNSPVRPFSEFGQSATTKETRKETSTSDRVEVESSVESPQSVPASSTESIASVSIRETRSPLPAQGKPAPTARRVKTVRPTHIPKVPFGQSERIPLFDSLASYRSSPSKSEKLPTSSSSLCKSPEVTTTTGHQMTQSELRPPRPVETRETTLEAQATEIGSTQQGTKAKTKPQNVIKSQTDEECDENSAERTEATPLLSAANVARRKDGEVVVVWTRDADGILLHQCRDQGATQEVFDDVAKQLGDKTADQVADRFSTLMKLFQSASQSDDDDSASEESEDETEDNSKTQDEADKGYLKIAHNSMVALH